MSTAFADSTFYVALLIARDAKHSAAVALAQRWMGSIVTTEYVLTEVGNYLCGSSRGREKFGDFLKDTKADANTIVVESTHELWARGVELYLRRKDKQWSLIDCISFVVMDERGLGEALAADHHFEQ